MTNAMKTMLRELMGYQSVLLVQPPRAHSRIVSRADRRAAEELAELGIVRINGDRAVRVVRDGREGTPSLEGSHHAELVETLRKAAPFVGHVAVHDPEAIVAGSRAGELCDEIDAILAKIGGEQ
jgi:hypothetical protein